MTFHYEPTPFMLASSHYDKSKADRAVTFIQNLCHTKGKWAGQKFILLPWQEQIVRDIFGIVKEDGNRQFLTAYIEIPKKNGKSELAAAIALYLLYADNEASAEVYADGIRQEIEGKIADVDSKVLSNELLNENRYNDVLAKANSSRDLANHALEVSKEVKETTNTVLTDTLNYKKEAIAEANRLVELSKNSLLNQITTVESSIDKLTGVITNKVSKTDFDAIKNTVEQQRTEISQAKDKINLNGLLQQDNPLYLCVLYPFLLLHYVY